MNEQDTDHIAFAEFELDRAHRKLYRDSEPVAMYAKTFDLLEFFADNSGAIVSKDQILEHVWPGQFVEESNLSVQVSALRKALGERADATRFLVTIPGKGYKFVADIRRSPAERSPIGPGVAEATIAGTAIDEKLDASQHSNAPNNHTNLWLTAGVVLVVLMLGVAVYNYLPAGRESNIQSLAVLPFVSQTSDASTEYLNDGLAESVIHALSGLPDLRVMSRSSSFNYKGSEVDAKKIGRELNVRAILTGRIAIQRDTVTVSTELVSTEDNSVMWGETFSRPMSDLEKLQSDIAGAIAQKLKLKLSGVQEERVKTPGVADPEAYRLYLLGRYHIHRLTDDGFRKSAEYFQQAIDRQSDYALAYAGLAEAHNRLSGYNAVSPHDGFPKAREAALKALEIDPSLPEAHTALGSVRFFYDWDWVAAEREYRQAIELDPNSPDAHQMLGYFLAAMGRSGEALAEMTRAHELDPLSIEKLAGIGEIHYLNRDYDKAITQFQRSLEMDPNSGFANWAIGRAQIEKHAYSEAIGSLQKSITLSGDSPDELVELARANALSGRKSEALKNVDDLTRPMEHRYVAPTSIGSIYAALGDTDRAFEWYERAFRERDVLLVLMKVDPMFDGVRSDPRFNELMKRVGLS
jgi:TolB-like protein/DNA-binding winged helix-turn-helix (wHTH) protein/Tfp pilus assembly protein PilF